MRYGLHYYLDGGLNMVNIEDFVKSLKPTWVKRILLENDSQWCQLLMTTLGSVKNLLLKGGMVYY